uniref:Saposin B-type domain-containing protein n=1 Tax=Steinernema glaseri TaxID=37863 RepID=A0A1I7YJ69_9BILA
MNKYTVVALFALLCLASAITIRKSAKEVFMTQTLAKMNGLLCDLCQDIVKDAENAGEEYSDHWLDDKIHEMCSRMGFFSDTCEQLLKDVVGDLDGLIKQKLSPEVCCKKVDLCD